MSCCETCCDEELQIYGDDLYQWDVDRMVVIPYDSDIEQVHFSHCKEDGRALVVETRKGDLEEESILTAYIPNSLLTSPRTIYVWTWKDEHTISGRYKLPVHPRPRPDNYIYKPSDVITLESVTQWVKDTLEEFMVVNASDYEALVNKPSIEGVELSGNLTLEDFGVIPISNDKIDSMFK